MRYYYFLLRFGQWFKNHEGQKAFAHQCMNWLLRSTLNLAAKLQKQNKKLAEKIKELSAELTQRLLHPVINADDYATLRKEIRNYTVIEWIIIVAETFFNFFAAKAIFNFPGWLAITAQVIFALGITWVSIPLFRNLFHQIIYEPPYKSEHKEPRSWKKLVVFLVPCAIVYEFGMYNLCKLRGEQIEGGTVGFITVLMIVIGMMLPAIAGYFAYERRRYYAPYKNTLRIKELTKLIACKENKIAENHQKMETHFKQNGHENWAYFQEFKNYKENYNRNHSIPEETLAGHYAETFNSFIKEAIERYKKEAIHVSHESASAESPAHLNGQEKEIRNLFVNA